MNNDIKDKIPSYGAVLINMVLIKPVMFNDLSFSYVTYS